MLNLAVIRSQFPALEKPVVFLDNPGGTQVARSVVERMTRYLTDSNANHGGEFETSRISDAIVDEARQRMADFLNARRTEEIIFGPNMTSLTFQMSRALGKQLRPGDTIVVTRLDHDANISPWVKLAEDLRLTIRWVDFHPEDGTLNLEDFEQAMRERPRLVAFGYASNALGTVNPVAELVARAHRVGALTYVDAVQYAPHGPIDVQTLDVDFLVCSAYKFFGPHVGVLYGKYELLESLPAYKVRPAPEEPPGKFEMGTGNFEGIAGVLGALEYLEWMGKTFGGEVEESLPSQFTGRRRYFKSAMAAIRAYEFSLSRTLLDVLEEIPGIAIYGITDHRRLEERVPTVSFTLNGKNPKEVARMLDERQIQVWNGNFYALAVTQRLGLEESGGLVRVGPVHYNTIEELERLGRVLWEIAGMQ
ncbi:cysteine desulfurase-like protein [Anaerolinea sp.]|uniref:cysteine desulfurase-like protein n=1 Tax=Anaerolinea sp. TaxID=1872519 RepID=UPI002ACD2969|nr:cysteine desulfurase-like protein [Anaerolinea sp.]